MDFTGQFRLDEDSVNFHNYTTPIKQQTQGITIIVSFQFKINYQIFTAFISRIYIKLIIFLDPDVNPNSMTQTIKKKFEPFEDIIIPKKLFDSPKINKKWSLKHISNRVIEELKNKAFSYSDISAKLTQEMINEIDNPENNVREIQNLRRRVYDALNVMISIGLVVKNQKLLSKTKDPQINLTKSNLLQRKEKIKIQMITKRQFATQLIDKQKCLQQLIDINKTRDTENVQKIFFPFLLIKTEFLNPDEDELILENNNESMQVLSKNPLQIEGDLNVVQKLLLLKQNEMVL